MEQNKPNVCKSVFKGGSDTISKSMFTKKWIELINSLERGKNYFPKKP